MNPALAATIIAVQSLLVLRRVGEGLMEIVPPPPRWVGQLPGFPDRTDSPFPLTDVFPYLEAWMPELEAFWNGTASTPPPLGVWTEPLNDGGEIHLEAKALALSRGLLIIHDAREQHSDQQRVLQLARLSALEHERLMTELSEKEILLHCVIHDLAGPLAGIHGCLELLARSPMAPADAELIRLAQLQAGRQGRLIRDILDVFASQIASMDRFHTDHTHAPDLQACINDVTEGLRAAFVLKHVDLKVEFPPEPPPRGWRVIAELSRLERVLYNLLENALRFAPPSSTVTVLVTHSDPWIRITVIDEGPGVRPEVLPRLFQRFVSGGRSPGKSGLGLFFCRIAVERWGGSIACDSGTHPGARFTISLRKSGSGLPSPGESGPTFERAAGSGEPRQ